MNVETVHLEDTDYFTKPPAWTVQDAWIKWDNSKWNYGNIPTLVAAYSKSTNGEIYEGKIIPDEKRECGEPGGILLTSKYPSILYRKCGEKLNDLSGIIYYTSDEKRTDTGFPYIRIPSALRRQLFVPVMTASRILAKKLAKKEPKLELFIEVNNDNYNIPIIKTEIPGKTDSKILVIAHLCHPKPGSNDNASGSATLLWLAEQFNEKMRENWQPNHNIQIVWTPEYLGTFYALETGFINPENTIFALNLDMVGGDPRLNGGSLNLIESSPSSPSIEEAIVSYFLENEARDNKSFGGSSKLPYIPLSTRVLFEFGSDHDVLASYSIPAVMINQWPDRYYHTNEDSPDKISPQILQIVGQSALKSLDYISGLTSEEGDSLSKIIWKYLFHSLEDTMKRKESLVRNGIESLIQRYNLIKTEELHDPNLRKLVEEQLDRIITLLNSFTNIFTYHERNECFKEESYETSLKYIPNKFAEDLDYEYLEKYYDPLIKTLLLEFYRLLGMGWNTRNIERYLRGYYGISDNDILCTIKHFIEELYKKNLLKKLDGG